MWSEYIIPESVTPWYLHVVWCLSDFRDVTCSWQMKLSDAVILLKATCSVNHAIFIGLEREEWHNRWPTFNISSIPDCLAMVKMVLPYLYFLNCSFVPILVTSQHSHFPFVSYPLLYFILICVPPSTDSAFVPIFYAIGLVSTLIIIILSNV